MSRFIVVTAAVLAPLAARASGVPHLSYGEFCLDASGTKVWFMESSDPLGGPGDLRSVDVESGNVSRELISNIDEAGPSSPPPGCTALHTVRVNDVGVTTHMRWGAPEPEMPNDSLVPSASADTVELELICPATLEFLRANRVIASMPLRVRCRIGDHHAWQGLASVTPLVLTTWVVPDRNFAIVVVNPRPMADDAIEHLLFVRGTTAPSAAALKRPARYQRDMVIAEWPLFDLAEVSLRVGEKLALEKRYLLAARWFELAASSAADRTSDTASWNVARSHEARFKLARVLALAARFDDAFLELSVLVKVNTGVEALLRSDQAFVPMHVDPRWNSLLLGARR